MKPKTSELGCSNCLNWAAARTVVNESKRMVGELGKWQWCDRQVYNVSRCVLLPAGGWGCCKIRCDSIRSNNFVAGCRGPLRRESVCCPWGVERWLVAVTR